MLADYAAKAKSTAFDLSVTIPAFLFDDSNSGIIVLALSNRITNRILIDPDTHNIMNDDEYNHASAHPPYQIQYAYR